MMVKPYYGVIPVSIMGTMCVCACYSSQAICRETQDKLLLSTTPDFP